MCRLNNTGRGCKICIAANGFSIFLPWLQSLQIFPRPKLMGTNVYFFCEHQQTYPIKQKLYQLDEKAHPHLTFVTVTPSS